MPGGDATGPMGMGPMTGRSAGFCGGRNMPGPADSGARNMRGRGRGWRHWFHATGLTGWQRRTMGWPAFGGTPFEQPVAEANPQQQLQQLQQQAQYMENTLQQLRERIQQLQNHKSAE